MDASEPVNSKDEQGSSGVCININGNGPTRFVWGDHHIEVVINLNKAGDPDSMGPETRCSAESDAEQAEKIGSIVRAAVAIGIS